MKLPNQTPTVKSPSKSPTKPAVQMEWHVVEDERQWEAVQRHSATPFANQTVQEERNAATTWQRWGALALCLFFGVALLGTWAWQRAEVGLDGVKSEVKAEIIAEVRRDREANSAGQSQAINPQRVKLPNDPNEIVTQLEIRDIGSDWVVVEVVFQQRADGPLYRQTRLYRQNEQGWVKAMPSTQHWGALRLLESDYFMFQYRALDQEAVLHAAPRLDALYLELGRSISQRWASAQKIPVTVTPGLAAGQFYQLGEPYDEGLVVASPSATLAPVELAAGDLLLQSLALALYDRFAIDLFWNNNSFVAWLRLYNGFRLWFIWQNELPLAAWRKPLVQWIFAGAEEPAYPSTLELPPFANELCADHSLWIDSPLSAGIPILCAQNNQGEEKITTWPYHSLIRRVSLDSLLYSPVANADETGGGLNIALPEPGPFAIVLATLFEYVASTYGSEQLYRLVTAIPEHERVKTLIPAVLDVSLEEFEEGWRDFLAERYAIE